MSETGFTSLILAAAGGHLEVVKTLVEKVIMTTKLWYALQRLLRRRMVASAPPRLEAPLT